MYDRRWRASPIMPRSRSLAEEARQHVVLDLARQALFARAVGLDREQLPVVAAASSGRRRGRPSGESAGASRRSVPVRTAVPRSGLVDRRDQQLRIGLGAGHEGQRAAVGRKCRRRSGDERRRSGRQCQYAELRRRSAAGTAAALGAVSEDDGGAGSIDVLQDLCLLARRLPPRLQRRPGPRRSALHSRSRCR